MASATKPIQIFRNFLIGKKLKVPLRYPNDQVARTQPNPSLPDGPAHKLSNNYYCDRDLRRASMPPTVLYGGERKLLEGAPQTGEEGVKFITAKTPGKVYKADE